MTDNSSGVVILITLLNVLVYKLQKLKEAQQTTCLPLSVRQLCRRFTLQEIHLATNNFQKELVIGKGGFGMVYKGNIDFGQRIVAIKRLKAMSKQGRKEFYTEIEMLSQFKHSHLTPLVGYCFEREEMILVYEYMSSGNLADHLYKRVNKGNTSLPPLSWEQRLKICVGAAHALDYLHTGTSIEGRVIHRDVKTTNILLDENLEARISDFGLSKTGPANQTFTYVSTRVKGTPGYLDPYYVATHRLTRKSDVYAFGVVLFEVLCGRRAVDTSLDDEKINLAGWAQHCFKEGLLDQITDPNIKGVISSDSLNVYVDVAIKCLQYQPKNRPTMAEVVVGLESALTLQRKSTQYPLVEMMPIDYTEDVDCSIPELKDTNHSKEYEYTGEGIINVSNGWNHKKQSSVRIAFRNRMSRLLSVTARVFAVKSNKLEATNRKSSLPVLSSLTRKSWNQKKVLQSSKLKRFTFNELRVATRNFHPDSVIGKTLFNVVYKGWVNENTFAAAKWGTGLPTAIKKFNHVVTNAFELFLTEINILKNFCHPNIVKLIGYCLEDQLLVYEFMCQGSLDTHLFRSDGGTEFQPLSWRLRISIALGVAKGLAYLHSGEEISVIHGDIKPLHILIDSDYNAKLSGFGNARLGRAHENTHMITLAYGKPLDYLDPVYFYTGYFTMKNDVYSFGVVLLVILTGLKPFEMESLSEGVSPIVDWASCFIKRHGISKIMDADIKGQYTERAALKASSLALKCVSLYTEARPDAKQVVEELEQLLDLVNSESISNQHRTT